MGDCNFIPIADDAISSEKTERPIDHDRPTDVVADLSRLEDHSLFGSIDFSLPPNSLFFGEDSLETRCQPSPPVGRPANCNPLRRLQKPLASTASPRFTLPLDGSGRTDSGFCSWIGGPDSQSVLSPSRILMKQEPARQSPLAVTLPAPLALPSIHDDDSVISSEDLIDRMFFRSLDDDLAVPPSTAMPPFQLHSTNNVVDPVQQGNDNCHPSTPDPNTELHWPVKLVDPIDRCACPLSSTIHEQGHPQLGDKQEILEQTEPFPSAAEDTDEASNEEGDDEGGEPSDSPDSNLYLNSRTRGLLATSTARRNLNESHINPNWPRPRRTSTRDYPIWLRRQNMAVTGIDEAENRRRHRLQPLPAIGPIGSANRLSGTYQEQSALIHASPGANLIDGTTTITPNLHQRRRHHHQHHNHHHQNQPPMPDVVPRHPICSPTRLGIMPHGQPSLYWPHYQQAQHRHNHHSHHNHHHHQYPHPRQNRSSSVPLPDLTFDDLGYLIHSPLGCSTNCNCQWIFGQTAVREGTETPASTSMAVTSTRPLRMRDAPSASHGRRLSTLVRRMAHIADELDAEPQSWGQEEISGSMGHASLPESSSLNRAGSSRTAGSAWNLSPNLASLVFTAPFDCVHRIVQWASQSLSNTPTFVGASETARARVGASPLNNHGRRRTATVTGTTMSTSWVTRRLSTTNGTRPHRHSFATSATIPSTVTGPIRSTELHRQLWTSPPPHWPVRSSTPRPDGSILDVQTTATSSSPWSLRDRVEEVFSFDHDI